MIFFISSSTLSSLISRQHMISSFPHISPSCASISSMSACRNWTSGTLPQRPGEKLSCGWRRSDGTRLRTRKSQNRTGKSDCRKIRCAEKRTSAGCPTTSSVCRKNFEPRFTLLPPFPRTIFPQVVSCPRVLLILIMQLLVPIVLDVVVPVPGVLVRWTTWSALSSQK